MKGNKNYKVQISLLGVAKAFKADLNKEVVPGTKCKVELADNTALEGQKASVEYEKKTHGDEAELLAAGKLSPDGTRYYTGEIMPILTNVGFTDDGNGGFVFGPGNHNMIAGNFTSVFGGENYEQCAENYNATKRDVYVTLSRSAKGKLWLEFSQE